MRLTPSENQGIISALSLYVENESVELRLYGSRADDKRKGGDIDLLVLTQSTKLADFLNANKYKILTEIKHNIGEQKVDLTVHPHSKISSDPFLQMILPTSQQLHTWNKIP